MKYKKGDKLLCIKKIYNLFDQPLFIKNKIYTILYIDNNYLIMDHILYGSEYGGFDIDYVHENFISLKEFRKIKLEKINEKTSISNSRIIY